MNPRHTAVAALVAVALAALLIAGATTAPHQSEDAPPAASKTATTLPALSAAPVTSEAAPTPQETPPPIYTEADVEMLARLVWQEARGVETEAEKAAVIWCVLNRVDDPRWGSSIADVVTAPHQFAYYESSPATEELKSLAADVLGRWQREKEGAADVGRVLPSNYTFFTGDGIRNYFRTAYKDTGIYWNFSLSTPYKY